MEIVVCAIYYRSKQDISFLGLLNISWGLRRKKLENYYLWMCVEE